MAANILGPIWCRIKYLIVRSRQVSKVQDRVLEFFNCSEISRAAEVPVKFQSDTSILTPDLAPSRLREVSR